METRLKTKSFRGIAKLTTFALVGAVSTLGANATTTKIRLKLFEDFDQPYAGRNKPRGVTDIATRLRRLVDEDLLSCEKLDSDQGGKRIYALTETGRELLNNTYEISKRALTYTDFFDGSGNQGVFAT